MVLNLRHKPPGVGSRVTFRVEPAIIREPSHSIRHQRKLVADDNHATPQIISDMFGRRNTKVDLADSGAKVLAIAEQ